jgi:hypothetical protein
MTTTSYTGYSLYAYPTTGGSKGMAGRITDNGSTITPIPNLTSYTSTTTSAGDPEIEGFANGGNLELAVAPYVGSSAETVSIFDVTTGSAATGSPFTWAHVFNMYGIEQIGTHLYVLDFDNARIVELTTAYVETGKVFNFATNGVTGPLVPAGYIVHGQAILTIGGTLYGLFTITDSSWTNYQNSVLVKFTINATGISVGSTNYNNAIGKNAFAMAVEGSNLYIASLGGRQNAGSPNTNSALQTIAYGASPLNTATVSTVFGYSATYPYEVRDISFNGTTAYVLVGAYDASYVMHGKLLQTTTAFSTFTTINDFSSGAPGYYWAAQYIDNNRILFANGNSILYYNASSTGTPVATLAISNLESAGAGYTNLNDVSYVGSKTTAGIRVRGYRSPTQVSRTTRGVQARAIAKGRPELLPDEFELLDDQLTGA